jgi:hypothetical protein
MPRNDSLDIITEEDDTSLEDAGAAETGEAKPSRREMLITWAKGHLTILAFVGGLFLGWIIIGWLLFPVKWTNTDPWDLRPEYQRRYISLIAEDYWRTGDLRLAKQALSGWDDKALNQLLGKMQAQEANAEARQHLAALADAIKLPTPGQPLLASMLSEKGIVLSVVLSAIPMVAAIALVLSSLLSRRVVPVEGTDTEGLSVEELELLEADAAAQATAQVQQAAEQAEEEKKKPAAILSQEGTGEVPSETEDFLSSLFDDENEGFEHLEALSKGLNNVDIADLLQRARDVASQLALMAA